MTTVHDEILELAAASIDFALTGGERDRLAVHLAECASCRRRVDAIWSDQRALASLQPIAIDAAHATTLWTGIRRRRTPAPPVIRIVLLAAVFALLALAAAAVGGALLRDAGPRLGVNPPSADLAAGKVEPSGSLEPPSAPGSF